MLLVFDCYFRKKLNYVLLLSFMNLGPPKPQNPNFELDIFLFRLICVLGFNITREFGEAKIREILGTVFADNKVVVYKVRKNRKKLILTISEDIIRSNHSAHTLSEGRIWCMASARAMTYFDGSLHFYLLTRFPLISVGASEGMY